ncbi:AAA family ATPase [Streptomyces sp. NPDC060085]|uniref:AAA family ATPase n=1 Tax=Streptomyces sp. NPDC060085 TaxID=3347054 RepID=UPI00365288F4
MPRWPLVAREQELNAFCNALRSRRSRGFMVVGPAGVGKSRLAEECLSRAVKAGHRVGRATATAAAAAVPLGAIAHLIPAGVDLSDPVEGFAKVAAALYQGDRRPWVIYVDDLHLLDTTSVMLLRQLMDGGIVRLVGTLPTGETTSPGFQALTRGDAVCRIELEKFCQSQVEQVLQAALGGSIGRHTLRLLSEASGGNALFLRELVRASVASGALISDGEVWHLAPGRQLPGSARLTELMSAHLDAYGPDARSALELLALCGPLPLQEMQTIASMEILADLEQTGVISTTQAGRRTVVALAHPMFGEMLRSGVPALRRRNILLTQAERVEAYGARRRGDALQIATWRLAATGTADPALLQQAAKLARSAHDYPHAISLLEALPEQLHTVESRLLLGEAFSQMGGWKQAEAAFIEAEGLAKDDHERLVIALARTANLAWSNADRAQVLRANDGAARLVASPADHHTIQINEGFLRVVGGELVQGLALLENLRVEPENPKQTWLQAALMKPAALALSGRAQEAATWTEQAHAAHMALNDISLLPHPAIHRIPLILALTEMGQLADACVLADDTYTQLTDSCMIVRAWTAFLRGRAEWLAGHPATARRWHAEAAVLARTIDHAKVLRPALAGLAASAAVLGDLTAAETALDEYRTISPSNGLMSNAEESLAEAWLLAGRGNLVDARAVLRHSANDARSQGQLASEALLLTDMARLSGAKEAAPRLAEISQICDGSFVVARARFAAALATNDPTQLLEASEELDFLGADLLAAEAATTAASALRRAGHSRQSTAATRRAAQIAVRCRSAHTPLLTTAEATASLTAREREIALLAAAGAASKSIATTLRLSVRTVDNHLQHAYTKMGVVTRGELAATLRAELS